MSEADEYPAALRQVLSLYGWKHVKDNYDLLPDVADFAPCEWVHMLNVDERAYLADRFTRYAKALRKVSQNGVGIRRPHVPEGAAHARTRRLAHRGALARQPLPRGARA